MVRRVNDTFQEPFVITFEHPSSGAWTAAAAATGTITCATVANLADSDYMTIGDGINPPVLYEFDVAGDGVTAGRVQVNVSADTTAAQVAARLRTAILANQPALSVTDNADGTLTVTSDIAGAHANITITENVTHASFTVAGLTGGAAETANITADTTIKLWKLPRQALITRVLYINPTGLAEDANNHFNIKLLKGAATVVANWSTDSDLAGTNSIAADTFIELTLTATHADRLFAKDDIMSLYLDEGGTASLPPGRLVVEGRYL